MAAVSPSEVVRSPGHHGGPPLPIPALALLALTIGAAALGGLAPRPESTAAAVFAYDQDHDLLLRVQALLMLGSAFPLLVMAATLVTRWRRLGVQAPGPVMGLAGAVLAAVGLISSALCTWCAALLGPQGAPGLVKLLHTGAFASGSVGFVAPLGLLLAGSAVPAWIIGALPRWLSGAALVIAVLALASTLAVIFPVLNPLFPLGRFGGVLSLVVIAFLLPLRREHRGNIPLNSAAQR